MAKKYTPQDLGFKKKKEEEKKSPAPQPAPVENVKPEVLRDVKTGALSGLTTPTGSTYLGMRPDEIKAYVEKRKAETEIPAGSALTGTQRAEQEELIRQQQLQEQVAKTAVERRVFEEPKQELIIPPEMENLSVMARIGRSIIPKPVRDTMDFFNLQKTINKQEALSMAEISMLEGDLKQGVEIATSQEIDARIDETENILKLNGIPLLAVVGTTLVGQAVLSPIREFIGSDGQITSLENALSQYNEMISIPARSVEAGLSPEMAFDKLDRMEEGILALERQLKLSAMESPKVAIALRGRALEARLYKLKTKLQEARIKVLSVQAQEAFGEREVVDSMAFLRRLQNEGKV